MKSSNIIKGYVYSYDKDDALFINANIGDLIIKHDKKPPYIIVDHSLNKKLITRWPGRLFYVEVIDQENETDINKGLVKGVWYTRTFGVKILEEIPLERMFGKNGKSIKKLIYDLVLTCFFLKGKHFGEILINVSST